MNETVARYLNDGLLTRILDESRQSEPLRRWRSAELQRVRELIRHQKQPVRLIDFGCGDGRHLIALYDCLSYGLGIDIDPKTIRTAEERVASQSHLWQQSPIQFLRTDMECPGLLIDVAGQVSLSRVDDVPIVQPFDVAICLFSTILGAKNPRQVFQEMQRVLRPGGMAIVSVYSPASIPARVAWYTDIGEGTVMRTDPISKWKVVLCPAICPKKRRTRCLVRIWSYSLAQTLGSSSRKPCKDARR